MKNSAGMTNNFGHPIMDEIPVLPIEAIGSEANRKLGILTAVDAAPYSVNAQWAEFGTYQGQTARWMLPHLPPLGVLHLFDSYEGLSRKWSALPQGSFKTEPPVFDDPRVRMHNGWFENTVHVLSDCDLSFIHIDCDLYESTLDVLWQLPPLREGTIMLFDEYVHNLGGNPVDDEYRAFTEWIADTGYDFRYLWRTHWTQVCVEII
jgi:predicted O-methyltransferase YrrM